MTGFSFNTVPQVIVGAGTAHDLGPVCRRLGLQRPLLVSDAGLVALGLIQPVVDALASHCDACY